MNAIMKYPGSKWRIAKWIIDFFPAHHSYLEPYLGSGAVFFNKSRSNIETINDLDDNVINLFRWIKDDPARLAHEIYWTPYAKMVYEDAYQSPKSELDQAVKFYIRLNMGHGFRTNSKKVGWKNDIQGREKAYAAFDWCKLPNKIVQYAERLRGVQIENRPAIELIPRFNYPNVLIYLDPPYVLSERYGKQYQHEMNDEDQNNLLDVALAHKGKVLISGYDSKLYNDRLGNWHRAQITSCTQSHTKKKENLWMNFEPPSKQISFFDQV